MHGANSARDVRWHHSKESPTSPGTLIGRTRYGWLWSLVLTGNAPSPSTPPTPCPGSSVEGV